jgi:hypothetical protein
MLVYVVLYYICMYTDVPGENVNIPGGHSIVHSKEKVVLVYVHVSYSDFRDLTVQYTVHCTDEQHAMSSHL